MKNKKTKTIMELVERLIKKRKQNKEETIAWFIACLNIDQFMMLTEILDVELDLPPHTKKAIRIWGDNMKKRAIKAMKNKLLA